MDKPHGFKTGPREQWFEDADIPKRATPQFEDFTSKASQAIEPWLSALLQSEHLNLLIGSGFTSAVAYLAGAKATGMSTATFGTTFDAEINNHAQAAAVRMDRGSFNIEDQFRSGLALLEGLSVLGAKSEGDRALLKGAIDTQLLVFLRSLLGTERAIHQASDDQKWVSAAAHLQSFLLTFASRSASRERLHVFTTNYDRLIEHGADIAGLRIIDRFVGALSPVFRSSRVEVDVHYNPPGIRGEPRFMEGVMRFTKLHGSLDWHFDSRNRRLSRKGIPFGAPADHSDLPKSPTDTVMIYPNPAKDVETTEYPYAELFRDFAAALCRPNSVVVTYGYGFGDDHVNRVLSDMLTIPSTHLVILCYAMDARVKHFLKRTGRPAQVTLLVGSHFADLPNLVDYYLPKPALDYVTGRMADLLKNRGFPGVPTANPAVSTGTASDGAVPF